MTITTSDPAKIKDWIAALTEFHAAGKPLTGDGMLVLRDLLIAADASLSKVDNAVNTIMTTKRAHRELLRAVKKHINTPTDATKAALVEIIKTPA